MLAMSTPPFHVAFPVDDLAAAKAFYGEVLNCPLGRSSADWIDFNLYGHQIVAHRVPQEGLSRRSINQVDGDAVPVPHFGVVLPPEAWRALAERVTRAGVPFIIAPHTRFQGEAGEQSTMFFLDPAGNALEFKAFQNLDGLFATDAL
jgi:extradiol dioxygenase family protein